MAKVKCSCGREFDNKNQQAQHSSLFAPIHKFSSPDHQVVQTKTKEGKR